MHSEQSASARRRRQKEHSDMTSSPPHPPSSHTDADPPADRAIVPFADRIATLERAVGLIIPSTSAPTTVNIQTTVPTTTTTSVTPEPHAAQSGESACHYTNLTVVRESVCLSVCDREVNGSNSNRAKKFSFSASLDLDVTTGSPLTTQRRH